MGQARAKLGTSWDSPLSPFLSRILYSLIKSVALEDSYLFHYETKKFSVTCDASKYFICWTLLPENDSSKYFIQSFKLHKIRLFHSLFGELKGLYTALSSLQSFLQFRSIENAEVIIYRDNLVIIDALKRGSFRSSKKQWLNLFDKVYQLFKNLNLKHIITIKYVKSKENITDKLTRNYSNLYLSFLNYLSSVEV